MLMHATAHRGLSGHLKRVCTESWLWVKNKKIKIPCRTGDSNLTTTLSPILARNLSQWTVELVCGYQCQNNAITYCEVLFGPHPSSLSCLALACVWPRIEIFAQNAISDFWLVNMSEYERSRQEKEARIGWVITFKLVVLFEIINILLIVVWVDEQTCVRMSLCVCVCIVW